MTETWCNWSRSVRCTPQRIERPESEAQLAALLRGAAATGLGVRVAGRGHSHTPLVATDGLLLELDALAGIEACRSARAGGDAARRYPALEIGAPLRELGSGDGEPRRRRRAGARRSDRDRERTAPAAACAASRTRSSDCASTPRTESRLECSEANDPRVFAAARVGARRASGWSPPCGCGCVPAYQLHERIWREDVEPALEALAERIASNRHFEFFWLPQKDRLELKALNPSTLPSGVVPDRRRERVGPAHEILPSLREIPIVEMEYAVPAEHGVACFLALRERMRRRHPDVFWPVEYPDARGGRDPALAGLRTRDGDALAPPGSRSPLPRVLRRWRGDLPQRAGATALGKAPLAAGRAELRELYPRWDEFHAVRRELDPRGRFLNDYLRELFGDAA